MYTLSQRVRDKPIDGENSEHTFSSTPRTVVLDTFENLEDACLALAKKQDSRKNTGEFFIEFRLDSRCQRDIKRFSKNPREAPLKEKEPEPV